MAPIFGTTNLIDQQRDRVTGTTCVSISLQWAAQTRAATYPNRVNSHV